MTGTPHTPTAPEHRRASALDERLDRIGWGPLLLMTGVVWLFPEGRVPPGTWLFGTGALLLALAAVRHLRGARVSAVLTVLGALALVGGVADLLGTSLPMVAVGLILVGGLLLLTPSPAGRG